MNNTSQYCCSHRGCCLCQSEAVLARQMKSTLTFSLTILNRRHPSSRKIGSETEDFWAWNHSTFGRGEPEALQQRVTLVPGNAPTNVGGLLVNLGGSEDRKNQFNRQNKRSEDLKSLS